MQVVNYRYLLSDFPIIITFIRYLPTADMMNNCMRKYLYIRIYRFYYWKYR